MSNSIINKLLKKHSKSTPVDDKSLQKVVGAALKVAAPVVSRAIGAGAKAAKPHVAQAGKTALDTAAVTAGTDIGHAVAGKVGAKPTPPPTPSTPSVAKQSPDVAARMWQRGLMWDGNKHRYVKRPETTHEDAPKKGVSYHNNVIVIPKDKSFWGSGATYGETEKASKVLASMIEHKFPGSTVIFGNKPIIQGEHDIEIDNWISRNWKKAVSRRRDRKEAFNKSDSHKRYSPKEIEKRKADKKWWEEKNRAFLQQHPEKRNIR